MPLIETFIVTAYGFSVMLDTGCKYDFYRLNQDLAEVYICEQLDHRIYKGYYFRVN